MSRPSVGKLTSRLILSENTWFRNRNRLRCSTCSVACHRGISSQLFRLISWSCFDVSVSNTAMVVERTNTFGNIEIVMHFVAVLCSLHRLQYHWLSASYPRHETPKDWTQVQGGAHESPQEVGTQETQANHLPAGKGETNQFLWHTEPVQQVVEAERGSSALILLRQRRQLRFLLFSSCKVLLRSVGKSGSRHLFVASSLLKPNANAPAEGRVVGTAPNCRCSVVVAGNRKLE